MNLKEAFRYQNAIQSMLSSTLAELQDRSNILKVSTTHFRSKVRSDDQDVTIEDNANSEYAGKANLLVEFASMLFTLFATAALYFKLDYEFLGAVQIAVYAGGIVVLFVFSILLTTRPGDNTAQLESRKRALGLVGAIAAAGACGWALGDNP